MHEDKLTHDERLRLECLAQAQNSGWAMGAPRSTQDIVSRAKAFEDFVRGPAYKATTTVSE